MIIRSLVLLIFVALPLSVHAQKLYKVLDENGNVSFSQYPPVVKKENTTVEHITVDSRSQTTITEGLDGKYCGKIRLLDQSSSNASTASYVKSLDKKRASWQGQLDKLSESIDLNNQNSIKSNQNRSQSYSRYNQGYQATQSKRYQESIAANTESVRDIRCALSWADSEYEGTHELIVNNNSERARLENIREDLQVELQTRCGDIPAYDPRAGRNDAVRKKWYDCSDTLRRNIDLVKQEISKL